MALETLFPWTTERLIQEILDRHEMDCAIGTKLALGKPMAYSSTYNKILYSLDYIGDYANEYGISETVALTVMTYHEIGHAIDYKNNPEKTNKLKYLLRRKKEKPNDKKTHDEYSSFIIENEHRAWQNGSAIVPEEHRNEYEKLNQRNIETYMKKLSLSY